MSNFDENDLETWPLEALKALLRAKREEEIEDIHKQLATKLKTYNKLEEENKKLKEMNVWLLEAGQHYEEENKKLKEELKEEEEEEEEKCEECGKCLEGEDKCGEGCPSYDKGWNETHAYNKLEE